MEELDLKELISIFWAKKVQIVLIIAIFIVIGFIYSYILLIPEYQSVTSILLAKSNTTAEGSDSAMTTSDVTLNQQLVSTYSALVTSESVINQVINNLGIDKTVEDLEDNITVTAKDDTEIIEIAVVDEEPETARKIANEVANVFINQIAIEYYNMNNVYIVDEAKTPDEPYNINHVKDLLLFAVVGFVVACIYVLVANMLDNTVKTKEDIEKKLGLTVLTTIPIYDNNRDRKAKIKGGRR